MRSIPPSLGTVFALVLRGVFPKLFCISFEAGVEVVDEEGRPDGRFNFRPSPTLCPRRSPNTFLKICCSLIDDEPSGLDDDGAF